MDTGNNRRHHHHSGGGGGGGESSLARRDELERFYKTYAREHAAQMGKEMRSILLRDQAPIVPRAEHEHLVRAVCEYYISIFRTLFLEGFEFRDVSSNNRKTATTTSDVRKNFSDSNFSTLLGSNHHNNGMMLDHRCHGNNKMSSMGLSMRMDQDGWRRKSGRGGTRKLSVDDEVFFKSSMEDDQLMPTKKKQPLKRWYSRVGGGMRRVDDVTIAATGATDDKGNNCLSDSTNKAGVMTSVWNRFRRGSKGGGGTGSKSGHDVIKLERTGEFRMSSNGVSGGGGGGINPFLRARLVLRLLGDLYQVEIYCPVKSLKPKYVIRGTDIVEVRPTAASKILESRRCFVLKSTDQEFVIKLDTQDDVLVWLTEIEDANRKTPNPRPHIYECYKHPYTPEFLKKQASGTPSAAAQQQQPSPTSLTLHSLCGSLGNHSDSSNSLTASKKQKKSSTNSNGGSTQQPLLNGGGGEQRPGCGRSSETRWNKSNQTANNRDSFCNNDRSSNNVTPTTTPRTVIAIGSWATALEIFAPPTRPPSVERRGSDVGGGGSSRCSPSTSTASSVIDGESTTVDASEENSGGSVGSSSSSSNGGGLHATTAVVDLTLLPWFHGHMSRSEASALATELDDGVFLLRYSANQQCHVITIAYQGRAKHLRLTIDSEGRCRVNDKNFPSVIKMLVFHHKFPIVVDASASTTASRVLLTDYVINQLKFGAGDYDYVKPFEKITSSSGGNHTLLAQEIILHQQSAAAATSSTTTTTTAHSSNNNNKLSDVLTVANYSGHGRTAVVATKNSVSSSGEGNGGGSSSSCSSSGGELCTSLPFEERCGAAAGSLTKVGT